MKIGLFFGSFAGGGAERMMVNLAKGLVKKKVNVTIYVVNKNGPYLKEVPENIPIVSYNAKYGVKSVIHKIRRTLIEDGLTAFISTQEHINTVVGLASIGLKKKPKIIFREANTPSKHHDSHLKKIIYSFGYKRADYFVAISEGVKNDMIKYYQLSSKLIEVIYSPVIDDSIEYRMKEKSNHPWLINKDCLVIIGMGRLVPQKDFPTLIKAFKIVSETIECRLIIYGIHSSESYAKYLKSLVKRLKINSIVDFAGFIENPFAVFSKADLFVQSPIYEGFGNVLVEAMACGCPVVSTDCPSGPREILKNGKYGKLVPINDSISLANAINQALNKPVEKKHLIKRAKVFSVESSTIGYLNMLNNLK